MDNGDEPEGFDDFVDDAQPSPDAPNNDRPSGLGSAIGSQFDETKELPDSILAPPDGSAPVPPAPSAPSAPPAPTSPAAVSATPAAPVGSASPQPSSEYPAAPPAFGNSSEGGSSKLPWIAAIVAAVILLGGGAFFALSALGSSGGAASPEEGIEAVLAAVGEEDFVTVAELMEPSERRTLAEPAITELLPELVRLGVFDDTADAGDIEGVDIEFTDVEFRVDRLVGVDDIAHVFLTGGEVAATVDSATLPFTDEVDTADLDSEDSQVITESDTPIVFVERDGDWFFSLWFTIAENARLDAGDRLPSADESPAQVPSDSPAQAIEGMFNAMTSFDLEDLVGHMDPDEMAVLYRYSPLFLADAQEALDDTQGDLRDEGIVWEMTDFEFDVDESGQDAVVTMRGFTLNITADGFELTVGYSRNELTGNLTLDDLTGNLSASTTEFTIGGQANGSLFDAEVTVDPDARTFAVAATSDGETFDGSLTVDPEGECSSFSVTGSDGTDESGCLEEEAGIDGIGPILEALEDWPEEFPGVPFRARETDGGWYVSPIGTVFDPAITALEGLEEGDFDDVFGDTFNGTAGLFGFDGDDPLDVLDDALDGGGSDEVLDLIEDDEPEDQDGVIGTFSDPVLETETTADVFDGERVTFEGEIRENGFDIFFLDVEAGQSITVSAEAAESDLDTTLRLVSPLGEQIAFNDDAPPAAGLDGNFDSQVALVAPETGTYIIEVAGFGPESVGDYQLEIDRISIIEGAVEENQAASIIDVEDGSLLVTEVGETQRFAESLTAPSSFDEYEIFLEAGETLTVSVEAAPGSGIDPTVLIAGDNDDVIAFNDDAEDGSPVASARDSFVVANITRDGNYFVQVGSFDGQSNGEYVMNVTRELTPPAPAIPLNVASGEVLTEPGIVEIPVVYSLDLEAGDEVTISVDADFGETLDPIVSLVLGEIEIGRNDDAELLDGEAPTINSRLIVTAPEAGTYNIIVEGFGGSRGTYEITVDRG